MNSLSRRFIILSINVKAIIFCLLLSTLALKAVGQSCGNCPSVGACGACSGDLTSLTLKFNQSVAKTITAFDRQSQLFVSSVAPGGVFSFVGSDGNGKFNGSEVTIKINGVTDIVFNTNCGTLIFVGTTLGSFTVIAGQSKIGGALCCSPSAVASSPPTITNCPSDIIALATNPAVCLLVVSWPSPIATDNCEVSSFTSNFKPGDSFPLGVTQVNYIATDNNGNTANCLFNVTIIDNAPPVFTGCPTDISVNVGAPCSAIVNWTAPSATDCDVVTVSSNRNPGTTFSLGTTTVTYSARDGSGNTSTCSFNVIVKDNANPVITGCPADITVNANASCNAVVTWSLPSATDNCDFTVPIVGSRNRGDTFTLGSSDVTYTATDAAGNKATCSFKVIVKDVTKPVLTGCPSDITVSASALCNAVVSWTPPLATDNCSANIISNHNPGETFALGTTLVTYTAIDGSGNTATCFFNVIVKDDTNPVFTNCPVAISVSANPSCQAVVSWIPPIATDNCTVTLAGSNNPGDTFSLGTKLVTYKATDGSGNSAECFFSIAVVDNTKPVITGCPTDIKVFANSLCNAIVNWTPPTATDNCTVLTLITDYNPNDTFPLGTTVVTYQAKDQRGNISNCSFTIIVSDNTPPVFAGCPTDIIVSSSNSSCETIANWIEPTVKDNCSSLVAFNSNFKPGDTFQSGTTTKVIYTAVDDAGNKATCQFNVTVRNESLPVISGCPKDIEVKTDETGRAIVQWDEPIAKDQCGDVKLKASHKPNSEFSIGITKVVYESPPNTSGATAKCEFNVILSYKEISFDVGKVITPNSDIYNKDWMINGIENFSDNEVLVVDRWGNTIYQASHYDNNKVIWNGANQSGTVVPTGTYFYSVAVSFRGQRVEKRGSVEVVR